MIGNDIARKLVLEYLEFTFDEFCEWLEDHKDIEGTEGEVIIKQLEKGDRKWNFKKGMWES